MRHFLTLLAAGVCAAALAGAAQAADVSVKRIECGTPQAPTSVNPRFSDTYSYGDLKIQFVYSCYLIKHGDDYLLWDTGHAMTTPNVAPKVSIVDQLEKIGQVQPPHHLLVQLLVEVPLSAGLVHPQQPASVGVVPERAWKAREWLIRSRLYGFRSRQRELQKS